MSARTYPAPDHTPPDVGGVFQTGTNFLLPELYPQVLLQASTSAHTSPLPDHTPLVNNVYSPVGAEQQLHYAGHLRLQTPSGQLRSLCVRCRNHLALGIPSP